MQSPADGWAIGGLVDEPDHVLRTVDGGTTWIDVTPPEPLRDLPYGAQEAIGAFADTDSAWVVYSQQVEEEELSAAVVWRTEDGGQSWTPSEPLDQGGLVESFNPRFLGFADDGSGWLLVNVGAGMSHEYVVLYTSGDGGSTWERVLDPYGDSPIQVCWKTGLTFADAQTGWLTRDCGGVVDGAQVSLTQDGGRSWATMDLLPPADHPAGFTYPSACWTHSPALWSSQSGMVGVGCKTFEPDEVHPGLSLVYRTEDGGVTWESMEAPNGELGVLDGRLTWTFDRQIHLTPDLGLSWTLVKEVSWDGQFDFIDLDRGWAVARDGEEIALVRTEDGGKTWQLLEPVMEAGG